MGKIKYTLEIIENEINNRGYKLISNEKNKFIIMDIEGYKYFINNIYSFMTSSEPEKFHKNNPYTIQNINLWVKINQKPFELLNDVYENNHKKLEWKCLKENCGEIFKTNWNEIYSGTGCGFCNGKQVGLSNCLATKNPKLASEWHSIKNGNLTPYDVTYCSGKKVWWQCSKNPKHEWKIGINNRNNGDNCPYCSGHLASEDYNLLVSNPKLCEEWDYEKNDKRPEEFTPGSGTYAWWKCKECGYNWKAKICNRNILKRGCKECSESKGEKYIKIWLLNNNIFYIAQKKFESLIGLGNGNLSYDFYIHDYNLLIEFQGEQHERYIKGMHKSRKDFEKQQEHDRRKREYAQKHNINLLEIWYYDFDRIGEILSQELFLLIKVS